MINISKYKDIIITHGVCSGIGTKMNVYIYLVDGLLFDTGPSALQKDTREFFNRQVIEKVALTHVHEDHSGLAHWLQKNKRVPIYLHPEAIKVAERKGKYRLYRRFIWGGREPFDPQAMPEVIRTERYVFNAIDTPGHTEFHHVFHEKDQGWLITGDLYVGRKLLLAFYEENMIQMIASLEKVLQLDFDTILCSHAGVVPKGKEKMRQKLDFLTELQGKVRELRAKGLTDGEIDKIIYPQKRAVKTISGGEWSSYNIIHTI
ncbi:MBL fold metallo-hydrolase [Desulfitobacterium chlororespirans]|uniref:Glyoxylase, beta-lactamase superfamily II n=1 Tax=Desulfitobacterium chlororespirans DSM 11544 TaxID=1121395 RepID=A0A1M7RS06_9FIRM|nr:MBL fold metallo-hydrolase [Desulfitobacterium chlororespirans]SHN48991.1 Glyoxylase, beta-lactamase superfamily II [Desulfitobacterium chlororespirans DSM 11544]